VIALRPAAERGRSKFDWLDSRHTFSFAEYFDPDHMGFGPLCVINEDWVPPGAGFPPHGHRDMEIVTWVLEGALGHKDSLGNGSVIRPGDMQRMSAGTGIRHSEMNDSRTQPVHLLQIWIVPDRAGLAPGYEQKPVRETLAGRLVPIAGPAGSGAAVAVHQNATILAAVLAPGARVRHELAQGRRAWVQVARGAVALDCQALGQGDGAAITAEPALVLTGGDVEAEVLLFDLP
jgi:redox-sensitive bicupin YhaK (pirin superfamily)